MAPQHWCFLSIPSQEHQMQLILPSRLLRIALVIDAVATGALAVLQLALPDVLSRLLMLPRGLLLETGVFLVAYVLLLVVMARSQRLWPWLVRTVVIGNGLWAVGCVALLVTGVVEPGALGLAYVAMQALAVVAFAAAQYLGLRQSSSAGTGAKRSWQAGA
jgi:hypothetical protein